jgi:hypothetical protein
MTHPLSYLLFTLGVAVVLAGLASPVRAQPPSQPTIHLDSSQIQELQDPQEIPVFDQPTGPLFFPDSVLQNIRPESVTRVGLGQTTTDTSIVANGDDLSIEVGEVAVLKHGSSFRMVPQTSVDSLQPSAVDNTIFQAPATWVSNPSSGSPTQGTLFMRSTQNGFVVSERPMIFETTLQIWLASGSGSERIPIASPVPVVVSVDDAVSIESSPIELTHFNDIATVDVQAKSERDSLSISVGLPTESSPPRAMLSVHRPNLQVSASPTRIGGFGLGESTVQVRVPGSYPAPVALSAATQSATVKPATRNIEPGTAGSFAIRSWGVGEETIRIEGGPFDEEGRTVRIEFIWPVYFILFALAGSLVGGGVRYYRRRSAASDRPVRLASILASGVLIGIIGAVLYGIGVSLFPLIPSGIGGQSVVFVVSAAAAVVGPSLPFEKTMPGP